GCNGGLDRGLDADRRARLACVVFLYLSRRSSWAAPCSTSGDGRRSRTRARGGSDGCRLSMGCWSRCSTRGGSMTLVVSVRGLAMQYGRRLVFQELSFDLAAGQAAGVVGPNGSGKTTLLRALARCTD